MGDTTNFISRFKPANQITMIDAIFCLNVDSFIIEGGEPTTQEEWNEKFTNLDSQGVTITFDEVQAKLQELRNPK
jgi:hypothetical protein